MNTEIQYLYRDASNHKINNRVVIPGQITQEQQDKIINSLYDGRFFIPRQVGLPEERFSTFTEDDHVWFELGPYSFEPTNCPPTEGITSEELVANFEACKNNWDDSSIFEELVNECP